MKLTPELIKNTISSVAGEDVLPIVEKLKGRQNVSEFKLAAEIRHEINAVRNMLYRLYHANLVTFTRKKDKQKGWYIYYWTFNPKMIATHIERLGKQRLENLRNRLAREMGKEFYTCPDGCMRLEFVKAMDFEFKCPECGRIMGHEDNSAMIDKISKEIDDLEKTNDKMVARLIGLQKEAMKEYAPKRDELLIQKMKLQKESEQRKAELKKSIDAEKRAEAKKLAKKKSVVKNKAVAKKTVKKAEKAQTKKKPMQKSVKKTSKKMAKPSKAKSRSVTSRINKLLSKVKSKRAKK
ncbi:hypothetical protein COV93_06095 [Candidatus Woesearchaeota archaeon CG11_big_fil_rev_8_21_14_0_20_43_8]|nr:MAG: hypothetical protein COV93_06095 [Candidatus Woesearchaeota archaeon CG11_big_fil_rev_8_21_14_0_20_43_8]PIO04876.1 MAG: hypothetical protein COT47_07115 [Candidatus Woesearchaeota archaeon CG08_land_8_20_14_0_20_43_7]